MPKLQLFTVSPGMASGTVGMTTGTAEIEFYDEVDDLSLSAGEQGFTDGDDSFLTLDSHTRNSTSISDLWASARAYGDRLLDRVYTLAHYLAEGGPAFQNLLMADSVALTALAGAAAVIGMLPIGAATVQPISEEWSELDNAMKANEEELKEILKGLMRSGVSEFKGEKLFSAGGKVDKIGVRMERDYYDKRRVDEWPIELRTRLYLIQGETYRLADELAQRGYKTLYNDWERYNQSQGVLSVRAAGAFNLAAQLLEKRGELREAARYYARSAGLAEIFVRLGSDFGSYHGPERSGLTRLLNGHIQAFNLYKDLGDRPAMFRQAIDSVRQFVVLKLEPRLWDGLWEAGSDKYLGLLVLRLKLPGVNNYVPMHTFLLRTAQEFLDPVIDEKHLTVEAEGLLEEFRALEKKLRRLKPPPQKD